MSRTTNIGGATTTTRGSQSGSRGSSASGSRNPSSRDDARSGSSSRGSSQRDTDDDDDERPSWPSSGGSQRPSWPSSGGSQRDTDDDDDERPSWPSSGGSQRPSRPPTIPRDTDDDDDERPSRPPVTGGDQRPSRPPTTPRDTDDDEDEGSSRPPVSGGSQPDDGARATAPTLTQPVQVKASGSGCPAGTWKAEPTWDNSRFDLTFTQLEAKVTPAVEQAMSTCQLAVSIRAPSGYSYRVEKLSFGGYAYLENGTSAELETNYYFSDTESQQVRSELKGPVDDIYSIEDVIKEGLWSPCGSQEDLNIDLALRVKNAEQAGTATLELGEVMSLEVAWRRCER